MTRPPRQISTRLPGPWRLPRALLAVALGLWVGFGSGSKAEVAADSVSPGHPAAADDHSALCGCGDACRGDSCCCGPSRPKSRPAPAPPPAPSSAPAATRADNPCVGPTPCGDPAAPDPSTTRPIGKSASMASRVEVGPDLHSGELPPDAHLGRPVDRAGRIDEPPEASADA